MRASHLDSFGTVQMGTSLSYRTVGAVDAGARQPVLDFLTLKSKKREWWAESIHLFDNPHIPGQICGDTKLFCLLDDDDAADCFMAMKDAEFIVECLEESSKSHGIAWELVLAGEPAGEVRNGHRNKTVQQMLDSFDLVAEVDDVDFSRYDRESLLHQYPDR